MLCVLSLPEMESTSPHVRSLAATLLVVVAVWMDAEEEFMPDWTEELLLRVPPILRALTTRPSL